jgi:ubiquinone/menaquinone biosynthesis C-methylase UbiE
LRLDTVAVGLYERYVLPPVLDWTMRQRPIMRQRGKIVPAARGRVLEVGIGTGLNLSFYDHEKVEKVWGLDPSGDLRDRAARRAADAGLDVEFMGLSGEEIPVDDASFDTVVITYTLCTIPDAPRALGEMRRVLKPEGRLLFCEHGEAPDPDVARWQRRLNPAWRKISGGCNLDRKVPALVEDAGFAIEGLETMYLPGIKILTYNYWGAATPA